MNPTPRNNPTPATQDLPDAMKSLNPEARAQLVRAAAAKPVRQFTQFDFNGGHLSVVTVDELRVTDGVRLQLSDFTPKAEALAALDSIRAWIERSSFEVNQPPPAPPWLRTVICETAPLVLKLASAPPAPSMPPAGQHDDADVPY